ncbi:MAG: DoxX family protein [Parachlamydiales bacterium]|nr:DoxX family protein [Parachlamydiales bacterium]
MQRFYNKLISFGNFLQPLFLVAIRLFWGWGFVMAGLGKFTHMHKTIATFGKIGLPVPLLSAYAAASVELVCGALLVLGLFSRLVTLPLIATMMIALGTAHIDALRHIFEDPHAFTRQAPFLYLLICIIILVFGPGCLSIDYLLKKKGTKEFI